jgi:diaminopimelate decarboxylase
MQEAASRAENGTRQNRPMLELFPDTARIEQGELGIGGVGASDLADRFGTPLVVYCEQTIRARARELRSAVPEAQLFYGSKAFPNVAVLRVLAEEGIGADVSTLGELAFARAAGLSGDRLVVHGNAKSADELRAAADAGATVVLDGEREAERAADAGVRRVLLRVTLGVEADTHEAIRTGHHGSKFGLSPEAARRALEDALGRALEVAGLHVHVGSQLAEAGAHAETIARLGELAARLRDDLGWTAGTVNAGGGFGVRQVPTEPSIELGALAQEIAAAVSGAWSAQELPAPRLALEPGRALVAQAGVTLYRVRTVKRLDALTWIAVDGGMSDNPRPQLYGARYTALSATRAGEPTTESVSLAGLHCESGDVLVDDVDLPPARPGDLLAVPVTGAYTLAMASNYNVTPRPAAVLVRDGDASVVRRRETIDELLGFEG